MRRALASLTMGLAVAAVVAMPAPAFGQAAGGSGTPPVANCGTAAVGQTVACDLTGAPHSIAVTKFVNNTGGEPGTSSATGTIHFTVQVTSQTSGILGDPKTVTLQCGTNTLAARNAA